jgi:hypothetical protein
MNQAPSPHSSGNERWYDQDPALSKALEALRMAPSGYHAKVALNIISIIVDHYTMEEDHANSVSLEALLTSSDERLEVLPRQRWYDVDASLRSAMQVLQDTPKEYQARIIPNIAQMIELTLERNLVRHA